ncbi:MAG: protein kinase [Vicinamibacterales bacterium]
MPHSFMVGTSLGHYRILRLVGKGGMGDVYAADDLTLGRTVALKVLPDGVAALPGGLERFEREAKAAAALTHRGIVTLHSFEHADDVHFITMELVDGAPLAAHIPANGLPLSDLLRIAIDLADAVAAAHARGVVHRDLKPANVLMTADGQVKILDFGLAQLHEPAGLSGGDAPTRQLTGEGHIVGTVAYMSPEQAEGRPVDHRTDIFSLGVMLYQLATGRLPFQGDTAMSVLSAIIKDTPRPAADLKPDLPPAFTRVLKACLQKDPERRYQSAKDLRNELQTLQEELDSGELARPEVGSAAVPRRRRPLVIAAIAAAGALALAVVLWPRGAAAPSPAPVLQHTQLTSASGIEAEPALSPDGKWFLFVSGAAGNADIYLQSVGGQTAINVTPDSPAADLQPAFSPDGEHIAFRSERDGGGLFIMGRTGEAPRRLTSEGFDPAWSPDGRQIVYATSSTPVATSRSGLSTLKAVQVDSGIVRPLTEDDAMHPAWSPNGRFVAYWGLGRSPGSSRPSSTRDLWVVAAEGGAPWRLTDDEDVDWCPQWAPDGSFLYFISNRGGSMNLWRLPMDPDTARPAGPPQAVTTPAAFVGRARLSQTGEHLVFEARVTASNIHRAPFDATRAVMGPIEAVTTGSRAFRFVIPSPDGRFLALGTGFLQQEDLFISATDGSGLRQLTTDAFNDRWPEWSPDSELITFYSNRSGKYEIWTATKAGQLRQITDAADFSAIYPHWSPDGTRMIFSDVTGRRAVVMFDPRKPWRDQTPEVLPAPAGEGSYLAGINVQWSPDSTQLAGIVNGVLTIYDIRTRRYRPIRGATSSPYKWLRDGRILIGPGGAPRLVDPVSGAIRAVAVPSFGGLEASEFRVSADERTVYFPLTSNDSDIWLVRLGGK